MCRVPDLTAPPRQFLSCPDADFAAQAGRNPEHFPPTYLAGLPHCSAYAGILLSGSPLSPCRLKAYRDTSEASLEVYAVRASRRIQNEFVAPTTRSGTNLRALLR